MGAGFRNPAHPLGVDFESIAIWWISRKKHASLNVCTCALLWSLWKIRNAICFQGLVWSDVKLVILKATKMARRWAVLCKDVEGLETSLLKLEEKARQTQRITWCEPVSEVVPRTRSWEEREAGDSSGFGARGAAELMSPLPTDHMTELVVPDYSGRA